MPESTGSSFCLALDSQNRETKYESQKGRKIFASVFPSSSDRTNFAFIFKTRQSKFVSEFCKISSFISVNIFLKPDWKLVACIVFSVAVLRIGVVLL